ncbi:peptide/nickel transport system permease protein [Lachnotalea glycerini]|uniref:Peptide/nickel transport system permease protein n=1 Tax=Lachnotalea glycerini TaxID=1763509 RepID=A0A318EHG8_9FIRM|nr:nickel ABC transporter permease subunit NikC [Lachnotalea glycerini]PXV85722.1 peptide/nickel transport system permease protein [Lachnotalea glycerini]
MTKKILKQKGFIIGLAIVIFFILIAVFAPYIAPNNPLEMNISCKLQKPSSQYWLGTDNLGRCIASRIIWGARSTLLYSMTVLTAIVIVSIPIGLISGYVGGRTDAVIMRVIDIIMAIPSFMLVLAVAGTLGASARNMIIAMSSVWWAGYARIIRGMAIEVKQKDFILALKSAGCSHVKIITKHIFKNIAEPIIVLATLELGSIILAIASFSFIGLGAQPPTPEWGIMISDSKDYIQSQPQLMIYPGIAIIITVIGFNMLGEGLKNAFGRKLYE